MLMRYFEGVKKMKGARGTVKSFLPLQKLSLFPKFKIHL